MGQRIVPDNQEPHVPVLLAEVLEALRPLDGARIVDGTFGAGGYSRALLEAGANVLAIDRDPGVMPHVERLQAEFPETFEFVRGTFSELDQAVAGRPVDGVVLDIGVSSMQFDEGERGFSFRFDGPLDMRMGGAGPSAADIVNGMEMAALARVIAVLGEEKRARSVAKAIAAARTEAPITRTTQLADIVARAVGRRPSDSIHPATRTFQALRIFINQELEELAGALAASEEILGEGGRLVVVSFHSLEDRIVKRFLAERSATRPGGSRHLPEHELAPATFELLTRAAVTPGEAEIRLNARARSARLRAGRRTAAASRPLDPASLRGIGVPALPELALMKGTA